MVAADFNPPRLVIKPTETVTWWNQSIYDHTVTAYEKRIPEGAAYFSSGGFESEEQARNDGDAKLISDGGLYRHTFEVPGHYHYFCIPHETWDTMAGTIIVTTPDGEIPEPPEVVIPDTDHVVQMGPHSYFPEELTIQTGESVGWVNGTGIAHSVTASSIPDGAAYFASGGFVSETAARRDWGGPREGDVLPSAPFTHTFETVGEYEYYCILHDLWMRGTITVRSA
ncbi:plastocyanin/azurin family copper-binding protein [Haladaptatus sp. GCM10025707]|uniref:cupredoxin domain-containing protein n=1 Tax=unclassified Haladaptatus TaxID=2622732 RepID=UPI0023E817F7|nr:MULTISPECIES: plastocyanin/azurin family copper-binding protein [unclassified Haladaptatus]